MQKLQPPSAAFPLGTDHPGRCILSRLIYGSRVSLSISLVVIVFTTTISLIVGLVAGYVGGKVDSWLMRLCDVSRFSSADFVTGDRWHFRKGTCWHSSSQSAWVRMSVIVGLN